MIADYGSVDATKPRWFQDLRSILGTGTPRPMVELILVDAVVYVAESRVQDKGGMRAI